MNRHAFFVSSGAMLACCWLVAGAVASEPALVDLEVLNARIGLDYAERVSEDQLLHELSSYRVWFYGATHDQRAAPLQFVQLVERLRKRTGDSYTLGVEFVDRSDADLLNAYLSGVLSEEALLERVYPTSLLRSPDVGEAHMELLRYARSHAVPVVGLESRPAGARTRVLRHAEIRWNLSEQLGRHPDERLAVLYGVDHVLGEDPITQGLQLPFLVVTTYGDSIHAAVRRRERRALQPGECVRVRSGVFLLSVGESVHPRSLIGLELDDRDDVLAAVENVYQGHRGDLELVIETLLDDEIRWRRAAFQALVYTSGQTLAYDPEANEEERAAGAVRWQAWWRDANKPRGRKP